LTYKIRHILKRAPFALGFNGDWEFSYWIFCSLAKFRQVRLLRSNLVYSTLTGHNVCRWSDMKGYLHKLHSLLKGDDAPSRKLYVSCSPHLAALTAITVRSRQSLPNGTCCAATPQRDLILMVIISAENQSARQERNHPMLGKNRNFSTAFPPLQEWIALLDQELDHTIETFPEVSCVYVSHCGYSNEVLILILPSSLQISLLDWETRWDARDMKPAARRRIFWLDWCCLEVGPLRSSCCVTDINDSYYSPNTV
jgi:hypothetical protein